MRCINDEDVTRWMEEHQGEMICCPHQPGLLLISKKACLKRFRAALSKAFESVSEENPFHYTLKKGLSVCEGCPIGQRLDREDRERTVKKGRGSSKGSRKRKAEECDG